MKSSVLFLGMLCAFFIGCQMEEPSGAGKQANPNYVAEEQKPKAAKKSNEPGDVQGIMDGQAEGFMKYCTQWELVDWDESKGTFGETKGILNEAEAGKVQGVNGFFEDGYQAVDGDGERVWRRDIREFMPNFFDGSQGFVGSRKEHFPDPVYEYLVITRAALACAQEPDDKLVCMEKGSGYYEWGIDDERQGTLDFTDGGIVMMKNKKGVEPFVDLYTEEFTGLTFIYLKGEKDMEESGDFGMSGTSCRQNLRLMSWAGFAGKSVLPSDRRDRSDGGGEGLLFLFEE